MIEAYCSFTFILPLNVVVYIIIFYNVLSWSLSLHCQQKREQLTASCSFLS